MSKAERTKQFIVEKTAPIFNVKGYAGTSVNDMMAATGLTKGSIYGNFRNKDDVALAAFDHNRKKVDQVVRREMEKEKSAKGKLMVYAKVYGNFYKDAFPEGGCPILNTAIEADDTHAVLREKAADAITGWKNNIAGIIQKGVANNEFSADVDPEQIAISIVALIEGGIMVAKVTGKLNYRTAIMKSVEKMINDLS
ncbi:TetR/AcrR family transcriptional regulator [Dyadobacter bucti]|uniref:TetR/AcrR family transcriptional regulator n=1 Tax=Dyadobacter bucti TaxID=2572203 RepID=UPI001107EA9D|nr:TetR/AcrR family transcriptional regulator [Dyadobacter bucti]